MRGKNYKIRVLSESFVETIHSKLSYAEAVDRFLFYVHLALEDGLHVRCVNIILGNKSIRTFINH